jgi:hypothetical protein
MKIAGSGVSEVKAVPSSGNGFRASEKYQERYIIPADTFYTSRLPVFCISPPVLNTDDVVFYDFPTSGATKMLGRQTSGLWVGESSVDSGVFYTGDYTFDTKVAVTQFVYDDRTYIYQQADGHELRVYTTQEQGADITDYTIVESVSRDVTRILYGGNPLNDPDHASFARKDPAIEKYELQYGTAGSANYGPFNLSTSDLVSVDSLVNESFRQVSLPLEHGDTAAEVNRTKRTTPSSICADENPVTLSTSSSFPDRITSTLNVHISFTRGYLQGGLE